MSATTLAVATPLTGRPLIPQFTWSFAAMHPPTNCSIEFLANFAQDQSIAVAPRDRLQNWYIEQAITRGIRYLFLLDEDVTCPPYTLRQLLFQMQHQDRAAIVGGVYPTLAPPHAPSIFREDGSGPYWDWRQGELFEVHGTLLGACLLNVAALAQLKDPWISQPESLPFVMGGGSNDLAELGLCARLREAGWRIYADAAVVCGKWDAARGRAVRFPAASKPAKVFGPDTGKLIVLDLGAGEYPYPPEENEEVFTVDLREEANPDFRCDLRKLPFDDGSIDRVKSSHVLEHLGRDEVDAVLDEWIRVLKPDGTLHLRLPNIQWAAEMLHNGILDHNVLNVLYGAQSNYLDFHKVGFTPDSIRKMLERRGFMCEITLYGYNIDIRAKRVGQARMEAGIASGEYRPAS